MSESFPIELRIPARIRMDDIFFILELPDLAGLKEFELEVVKK